jgi:predicted AAA+ superfamily ATPase
LRPYGGLNYLAKGSEYEIDFILTSGERAAGLEVKYHPIQSDEHKLKRIAAKHGLTESWLVGKYPTPGFSDFIWGGSIF